MKKLLTFLVLAANISSAAPPPKLTTVIFDPKTDTEAYSFIPTPGTCELQLISSNLFVWVKYDEQRQGRGFNSDTTVYVQAQVGRPPSHVVRFGGRRMPSVTGATQGGSLRFTGGEEFVASGDAAAWSSSATSNFFQPDIRHTCAFDIQPNISPSAFAARLAEGRATGTTPTFTLLVVKWGEARRIREVPVTAPSLSLEALIGTLPTPEQIRNLWPVVSWNASGFTFWNGTGWTHFEWTDRQ